MIVFLTPWGWLVFPLSTTVSFPESHVAWPSSVLMSVFLNKIWTPHFTHFILYHWRRKWQSTPVFLPGESRGQRSLAGRGLWGRRELDYKESWAPKNWCFWTEVLEKALESPLDCKELQSVKPNGNQPWIFMHWKDWCWTWSSSTLASWCEELT